MCKYPTGSHRLNLSRGRNRYIRKPNQEHNLLSYSQITWKKQSLAWSLLKVMGKILMSRPRLTLISLKLSSQLFHANIRFKLTITMSMRLSTMASITASKWRTGYRAWTICYEQSSKRKSNCLRKYVRRPHHLGLTIGKSVVIHLVPSASPRSWGLILV